ncbi:hypothetical protein AArcSl_0604 [Halalkaliarchaeum desulfuricum]|uniref:Uncharacterized protein n=1 Tax=Halalkaliarchaeum desulfuricum TaxID=2055893 RepID=A0A343TGN2_9EURY|nr:hypothetical protein [Halalkaliarchaeum desulfuricum]AUX08254.1 hypothetical protein AArcSl_0604 [Halalkaliarchaeum desulfuricum]
MTFSSRRQGESGSTDEEPPDVSELTWQFDHGESREVSYNNHRFECSQITSPNGDWLIAFGRSLDGGSCRIFVFHREELVTTQPFERPTEARIADDGTAIVVDAGSIKSSGGDVVIIDATGSEVVADAFNSNVHGTAITDDGAYASVVTLNPDGSVYVYETETGKRTVRHEIEHGRRNGIAFDDSGDRLYVIDDQTEKLLYAIDLTGEVVWRSSHIRSRVPRFNRAMERLRVWLYDKLGRTRNKSGTVDTERR